MPVLPPPPADAHAYDNVKKSSGVGDGVQGLQARPKKFWFAENLGKNGPQRYLASENGAQSLHKNTWRPFLEVTPKWSLWEKICRQKLHKKRFGQVLGNSAKSFAPQKFACSYTYDEKASPPRCHSFVKAEGKWSRHASILQRPCAYYSTRTLFTHCCRLQCVSATKINSAVF